MTTMSLKRTIWRRIRSVLPTIGEALAAPSVKQALIDQEIRALLVECRERTPDNPVLHGFKVFSQVDEDGIIENIFARIGEGGRTFIELGCGNGSENNTHYLALKGWSGVWIDGSEQNIAAVSSVIPLDSPKLLVQRMFITRDNIVGEMRSWIQRLGGALDLLSLDIDGNDAAILDCILTVIKPRVLVLEYNGKFPPPLRLSVAYDAAHGWSGDDYYGSSLQVFVDLLEGQYRLVSCGLSGANAYFVRNDAAEVFEKYGTAALYMHARHHLIHRRGAAPASLRYLRNLLNASLGSKVSSR
jgi:hypothetical protein